MILPPIVYEAGVNIEKRGRVVTRLGTMLLSQLVLTFLFIPVFIGLIFAFGVNLQGQLALILALLIQMNDYAGTLDPHVAFNVGNEDTLGYLGSVAIVRNYILLLVLTNMMPDTKSRSQEGGTQTLYGLYQVVIPLVCSLIIFVPTTLVLKKGKYSTLSASMSTQFDITITLMVPIFTYLVCETLKGSGLQALLICGVLQGVYGW